MIQLRKSIGLSRDELLTLVKRILPDTIEVDVQEEEDYFVLVLKYDFRYESSIGIHKIRYNEESLTREKEKAFLRKIRSGKQKEILKEIGDFFKSLADNLSSPTPLDKVFKEKYRDKNVIYKVKKWYRMKLGEKGTLKTNLEAFYHRKSKDIIPSFQMIWEAYIKEEIQHEKIKEITEYLHGANERFKHLIFAQNRIKDILSASPSGNDTWFLLNFYIYHFISTVKTLGDNLAWILSFYYKMNLNPHKTDLTTKGFQDQLKAKNKFLFNRIFQNKLYRNFKGLKDFRDIVQHRHALHIMRVQIGFGGPEKIMIPIDPESGLIVDSLRLASRKEFYVQYAEAGDKESMAKYGLKQSVVWIGPGKEPFEDPIVFCKKHTEFLSQVYNDTYERMILEHRREPIGKVTNYLSKLGVAIIELTDEINLNDEILIEGATTSLRQKALSIQIDRKPVNQAKAGQFIGLKINDKVRGNDIVYRL